MSPLLGRRYGVCGLFTDDGVVARERSRRPELVSPFAVDFFAHRSDRSTGHPIAQVKHPVALNHHVRILQQVLRMDRPEVALAGPEHHGYDVHAHLSPGLQQVNAAGRSVSS
jgi:hypothetical protein